MSLHRTTSLLSAIALLLHFVVAAEAFAQGAPPPTEPAASPPRAEESAPQDAYKAHMSNGVKLFGDKNYAAAIVEFEAAYAERPRASPLLNIALCQKSLFNYPKAVAALERALAKHADTMDAEDRRAAESAITEMRALLGSVKVEITPPHATLFIDGEPQPGDAKDKPIQLGPGRHLIAARAEGYESAEELVTITSQDQEKPVRLSLIPNKGWVIVETGDPEMAIAIDQQPLALGQWAGLVEPGTHLVQMYKPNGPEHAFQVLVVAGKAQRVQPETGGVPIAVPRPETLAAAPKSPPKKIAKPPDPPQRGPYTLAAAGVFFMLGEDGAGGTVGARAGYRLATPIALELLFDYASNKIETTASSKVALSSVRFGGGVRLMSPGRKARFVASIGGGIAYSWLGAGTSPGGVGFVNIDTGFEVDWSGVLLGLAAQQALLFGGKDTTVVALSDPRVTFGVGARIGFGSF